MDRYAAGRFPEALLSFEEALRRDPQSRAARVAVTRVRSEMAMMASAGRSPAAAAAENEEEDEPFLCRLERALSFDEAVGEEEERLGRVQAMQGRIAQLLAEKKLALARGRHFAKDRELHALSRRLA